MSAGDRGAEFAVFAFDVCMQLVHAPGLALAAGERDRLLQLATAAVRVLGMPDPAPAENNAILRLPAVWRYA